MKPTILLQLLLIACAIGLLVAIALQPPTVQRQDVAVMLETEDGDTVTISAQGDAPPEILEVDSEPESATMDTEQEAREIAERRAAERLREIEGLPDDPRVDREETDYTLRAETAYNQAGRRAETEYNRNRPTQEMRF